MEGNAFFGSWFLRISPVVLNCETVSHFITREDDIRQDNTIRHQAFWPRKDVYKNKGQLEVSVYRISGWNETALWEKGVEIANNRLGGKLQGRSDIMPEMIRQKRLCVKPDRKIHPRHANIIAKKNWPHYGLLPDLREVQKRMGKDIAECATKLIPYNG